MSVHDNNVEDLIEVFCCTHLDHIFCNVCSISYFDVEPHLTFQEWNSARFCQCSHCSWPFARRYTEEEWKTFEACIESLYAFFTCPQCPWMSSSWSAWMDHLYLLHGIRYK